MLVPENTTFIRFEKISNRNVFLDQFPYKQGQFLPGTHIPIKHPEMLEQDRPDYILILPWNLKDEIIAQLSYIREWGGKFVVAIPSVQVL